METKVFRESLRILKDILEKNKSVIYIIVLPLAEYIKQILSFLSGVKKRVIHANTKL